MNLEKCYPEEAELISWKRKFRLNRGEKPKVIVEDAFELISETKDVSLVLMTPRKVRIKGEKSIIFEAFEDSEAILMEIEGHALQVEIEYIDLKDTPKLQADWGNGLFRILLKAKDKVKKASWKMVFKSL